MRFFSATFFYARGNVTHFLLSGAKKRRKQPERYVPLIPNISEIMGTAASMPPLRNTHKIKVL
jgi:hypothetical protein